MKKSSSLILALCSVLSFAALTFAQSANDDPCLLYLKAARNHRPDLAGYNRCEAERRANKNSNPKTRVPKLHPTGQPWNRVPNSSRRPNTKIQ